DAIDRDHCTLRIAEEMNSSAPVESSGAWDIVAVSGFIGSRHAATAVGRIRGLTPLLSLSLLEMERETSGFGL
ncbi:hypothetical protein U1Q18_002478, partial [Sarracenia purpurea var. burkii]